MRNYKIFILFVLLSVVSFAVKSNGNGIGIDIVKIGITSTDPIQFELVIESRTGDKFNTPVGNLTKIYIENGNNKDYPEDVTLKYVGEVVGHPKTVTIFTASFPTKIQNFSSYPYITIGGEINIEDPKGNVNAIKKRKIKFGPFSTESDEEIDLRIYEKLVSGTDDNWVNDTTGITGSEITVDDHIFTKGGSRSFEDDPGVYVVGNTGKGIGQIVKLDVQRNDDSNVETIPVPFVEETDFSIKIGGFIKSEKNTVVITPVTVLGVVATSKMKTLDFLVDTRVNTLYLEGGIIGEINDDKNIQIDLSKLIELVGVAGYNYIFTVGNELKSDNESNLDGLPSTTLVGNSITSTLKWNDGIVEIPTSGLIGGSKGILLFTVYDKLGHKKTFEKTYFIPKQLDGITSKVSDEAKQRRSKIKVVTDGNKDEFGVESNIDKSNE